MILDGKTIQLDGVPEVKGASALPEYFISGLNMIFSIIEAKVSNLKCVSVGGIYFARDKPLIAAIDIWVQTKKKGYFMPMKEAATLFSENGIPYYHSPFSLN